jgi:hypothetical protein
MTNAEMTRRLQDVPAAVQSEVFVMIRAGYGAAGIAQNAPVTLKQANALFQKAALTAPAVSQ